MPVHIEEMTSDVAVFDGELPLSDRQMRQIVDAVVSCLEARKRSEKWNQQATDIRRTAASALEIGR